MPAIELHHDMDELTITAIAEFRTSPQTLWDLHTDPRRLEEWYAETVLQLELEPRGRAHYTQQTAQGTPAHYYWEFIEIHPGEFLYFDRGISDETLRVGRRTARHRTRFVATERGSQLDALIRYPTLDALQQALDEEMLKSTKQTLLRLNSAAGL